MGSLKKLFSALAIFTSLSMATLPPANAMDLSDLITIGSAFLTHLGIHESGHYLTAEMAGADEVNLDFFSQQPDGFFLGLSTAVGIDEESTVPYRLAGEAASSYLFEIALTEYRSQPSTYNKAVLFFSGADFLWYSMWAFYIAPTETPAYDPVGLSQETGLSPHTIFGMAAIQSALNAYRVYSGSDTLIPYIAIDTDFAQVGIQYNF